MMLIISVRGGGEIKWKKNKNNLFELLFFRLLVILVKL